MTIPDFKLERFFAKYEFTTQYSLCSSDCESVSINDLIQMNPNLSDSLLSLNLGYTESMGHPDLRREISSLYKNGSSDQVLICSGAQEAIFLIFQTLFRPSDHIIVQFPSYQSLYDVAKSNNIEVTLWDVNPEDEWNLDFNFLENSIKANTKAIVVNFPHNPTGSMISRQNLRKLTDIASKYNVLLVSDEVYRFSEFNHQDQFSMFEKFENSISIGVMSKSFGLAGLRIGWIITKNKEIFEKLSSFKDYTTICNSGPSEILAIAALQSKESILKRNLEIIKSNLKILDKFFKNNTSFSWIRPKAGTICFPQFNDSSDITDLSKKLRVEVGVLILPGSKFNYKNNFFSIGFGRINFKEAFKLFEDFVT